MNRVLLDYYNPLISNKIIWNVTDEEIDKLNKLTPRANNLSTASEQQYLAIDTTFCFKGNTNIEI